MNNVTISFWGKFTALGETFVPVFSQQDADSYNYCIATMNKSSFMIKMGGNSDHSNAALFDLGNKFESTEWTFFVLTISAVDSAEKVTLYWTYDGKMEKLEQDFEPVEFSSTAKIYLGKNPNIAGNGFDGGIDEFRLYNRNLSGKEANLFFLEDSKAKNPLESESLTASTNQHFQETAPEIFHKTDTFYVRDTLKYCPERELTDAGGITVNYSTETVYVRSSNIRIIPYDSGSCEDGDSVSINFNSVWLVEQYQLKWWENRLQNVEFKMKLVPNATNTLISHPWNDGKCPPNTLTIRIIDDLGNSKDIQIHAYPNQSNGGIRIVYEP